MVKIAGVVQIRDDSDIAEDVFLYYSKIGVQKFFVFLHKPVPEILKIIEKLKKNIEIETFSSTEYDKNLSILAHNILTPAALRQGFQWIVGFDVDDIFIFRKYQNLQDFLKQYDNHSIVSLRFRWADYLPVPDLQGKKFYEAMEYRGNWTQWTKCIAKFDESMTFVRGLHFAISGRYGLRHSSKLPQIEIPSAVAFCGHFPCRSEDQFIKKKSMRNELNNIVKKNINAKNPIRRFEILWKKKIIETKKIKPEEKIYDPISKNFLYRYE